MNNHRAAEGQERDAHAMPYASRWIGALTIWCGLFLTASAARSDDAIQLLPSDIRLSGPAATQRLLVQNTADHLTKGWIGEESVWQSSDESIVRVSDGMLTPVANGRATITVSHQGRKAVARVHVVGMEADAQFTFRNHVQSVFSKAGCNSGACHGALAGKGGLKLSLRGYDTERDFLTITRQARGRRIELADPGRSLILAKPTGAIAHKGGLRFETDSREYDVIAQWLSDGAASPRDDDPRLERLEIWPPASQQSVGSAQPLVVMAHFSDGTMEDVTRWAKFTSANQRVASVDDQGSVNVIGYGEGAVSAWYLSKIVIARISSPFPNQLAEADYNGFEPKNFIDQWVLEKLKSLRLKPSPGANDQEFIRRVFLDTIGTLPTPAEVERFLADKHPQKRNRLIEELLNRPEFVDFWAYRWSDVLLVNGKRLRPAAVKAYYEWIRKQVADNRPWDEFASALITSKGNSFDRKSAQFNGATNFYALHQDPLEMAENVSVAFLGLNINCARCHNHPLEKWTNNQYYAFANLFSRVRAKGWGGDARGGDGFRTLYVVDRGELIQPLTGKPQPPTPLDGEPIGFDDPTDRREHLVEWLVSPENPYFARAVSNRIWAHFFGVGLVEPADDLRVSNPASNEPLLAAAAQYLVDHEFDLKQLMRAILQSQTYQLSSKPLPENQTDQRFYSRYYPRRLMAEVMLDAISQVTDVPTKFDTLDNAGAGQTKTSEYKLGTRALQLRDSAVVSGFLETFGRNERAITCECERSDEPTMVQVLHIANGDTINGKLASKKGRITQLLQQSLDEQAVVDQAYLLCLARKPTSDEARQLVAILKETPEPQRRAAIEDLFWSLMSSREFLFNH